MLIFRRLRCKYWTGSKMYNNPISLSCKKHDDSCKKSGRTEKHLEHLEHLMSILAHLLEIESLHFAQIKYLGKCEHPMLKSIQWLQNTNNDGYYKVKNFRPYFFEYPKLKSISFDFKVEISYNHNNVSIPYL